MSELTSLPNIGPVLAEKLEAVGIRSRGDLESVGSVEAVLQIRGKLDDGCVNMLYALEGAIRGIRWHQIPKPDRESLHRAFRAAAGGR